MIIPFVGKKYKEITVTSKAFTFFSMLAIYSAFFSLNFCAEARFEMSLEIRNVVNI